MGDSGFKFSSDFYQIDQNNQYYKFQVLRQDLSLIFKTNKNLRKKFRVTYTLVMGKGHFCHKKSCKRTVLSSTPKKRTLLSHYAHFCHEIPTSVTIILGKLSMQFIGCRRTLLSYLTPLLSPKKKLNVDFGVPNFWNYIFNQ